MAKLLYIESSPRKERSHSIAVANEFVAAYRSAHPDGRPSTQWNLWAAAEQLPEFDGAAITAKYAMLGVGTPHSPPEADAWADDPPLGRPAPGGRRAAAVGPDVELRRPVQAQAPDRHRHPAGA